MPTKSNQMERQHSFSSVRKEWFPDRLKEAMNGYTLRGFSRECSLSEGTLRGYIKGESYPTLDRLEAIAIAAKVSATWLATGNGEMRPEQGMAQEGGDAPMLVSLNGLDEMHLLAWYRAANAKYKRAIMSQAEILSGPDEILVPDEPESSSKEPATPSQLPRGRVPTAQ